MHKGSWHRAHDGLQAHFKVTAAQTEMLSVVPEEFRWVTVTAEVHAASTVFLQNKL